MLKQEDIMLIEDYLDGFLTEEETMMVEKRILAEPKFRKEVRFREEINVALMEIDLAELSEEFSLAIKGNSKERLLNRASIRENIIFMQRKKKEQQEELEKMKNILTEKRLKFKHKVEEAQQIYFNRTNRSKVMNILMHKSTYIIAASIILLIWIGSILPVRRPIVFSGNELFSMYYKPYKNIDYYKANKGLFEQAMENYGKGNYKEAIQGLTKLTNNDDLTLSANFYLGISYIEMHDITHAVLSLHKVASSKSTLSIDASWYLSLCYLKLDKTADAIELLNKVEKSNHPLYKKNAMLLVKQMDKKNVE